MQQLPLQSTVSFSVAHHAAFNHLIQSHAYIKQRNGREEKALLFLLHNIINILNVLEFCQKKVAVQKWAAVVQIVWYEVCWFVALFPTCQNWHSGSKFYTCSKSIHAPKLKKAGRTVTPFSLYYKGQRAQCEAHGDKVRHNMFPVGERWPHCIRQDQPLRNTSVPLFWTHGHTPKGIERGVEGGREEEEEEEGAAGQRERQQKGYSEHWGVKGLYGRVNPLQGRPAGAWEDTERAAGRCWVVFSPREDQQREALPGNLRLYWTQTGLS